MYRNAGTASNFMNKGKIQNNRFNKTHYSVPKVSLYPIGPTIQQNLVQSPYLNIRQPMASPSYELRHLKNQNTPIAGEFSGLNAINSYIATSNNQHKFNHQNKQKIMIECNEKQIQEQEKRRDHLQKSYERQIQSLRQNLLRKDAHKQKLLAQIQTLQQNHDEFHENLMSLRPPVQKTNTYEQLDRKQQEIIIMKNRLLSQIRDKEKQYHEEQNEEQRHWQEQVKNKEQILLRLQQQQKSKRIQLHGTKTYKIDNLSSNQIQEEIREQCYQDYCYEVIQLQKRIAKMIENREQVHRKLTQTLMLKKPQIQLSSTKHGEVRREIDSTKLKVEELERVSQQMQLANENMLNELERKSRLIQRYELDIYSLKQCKSKQQTTLSQLFMEARGKEENEAIPDFSSITQHLHEQLRYQNSLGSRLKHQYQKLYELLCSATVRNVHKTLNDVMNST